MHDAHMNPCTLPTEAPDTDGDKRWLSIHRRFIAECLEKDADVVFMADCIFERLADSETWNRYFAPLHCLNFSIRNDRVENVLWRVVNGELDNIKPKIVVLHCGTNNIEHNAEQIAEGIMLIVSKIRDKLPDVYIVVPTLLPRGQHPNHLRDKHEKVNQLLRERISGMKRVQALPIDKGLVQSDGTISHFDMYDYKHLSNTSAGKTLEPLCDLLTQVLNENEVEHELDYV